MAKKYFKKCPEYITERVSKKGTHSLQITLRMNGETFMKSVRIDAFSSPREAMMFAKQLRDETKEKMSKNLTVTKIPTVREMYNATFESLPVRIKTKIKHGYFFKYGIEALDLADKPIDKITLDDVQRSINHYKTDHTKRQVSGLLAVWRRIYKTCLMKKINVIDITAGVIIKDCMAGNARKKDISAKDLETFLDALQSYNKASKQGHYYVMSVYYVCRVMQFTGMRPSEVFALKKEDINFITKRINIDKAVHSTETSYNDLGNVKNETSKGTVPIDDRLVPYLEEAIERAKTDFLFTDFCGNFLEIGDVDDLIRNARKKKCPEIDFTLYQLRHQLSTDMLADNVPLPIVRDIMRHSNQTTSLYYATTSEAQRDDAIKNRRFS